MFLVFFGDINVIMIWRIALPSAKFKFCPRLVKYRVHQKTWRNIHDEDDGDDIDDDDVDVEYKYEYECDGDDDDIMKKHKEEEEEEEEEADGDGEEEHGFRMKDDKQWMMEVLDHTGDRIANWSPARLDHPQ